MAKSSKLKVVPTTRPRPPAAAFLRTLGWGGVVSLLALVLVWLQLQTRALGYRNAQTVALHEALEGEKRALEVELATLRSPERLAALAESRLGLTRADSQQVVTLR